MTVKEIIEAYCSVHYPNAEGLCNDESECGCSFGEDIQPCNDRCMNCMVAKYDYNSETYIPIEN